MSGIQTFASISSYSIDVAHLWQKLSRQMECSMAFTSIEVVFMVPIGPSSRPTHMKFIIQAEITVQVFLQPFSFL